MKWMLALAQHPMYLLIREDTMCAERTPPWGAPTIEAYIERVRQNLASLEKYPQLKLGYEWSGVELELLALDSPETFQELRRHANTGRVCFYNGTYAQPHLQTLSSESNLRQYQFGQRVYRDLGLTPVKVYAHQEASLHDQVPQLLRAFDIPFAVVPGFLTTLVWLDGGEQLLHGVRGPRFVQGNEFTDWQGLDGTRVPLYLHQPIPREMPLRETLAREVVLGRLSAPPLLIDLPDMIAIDDAWIEERKALEFVTLDAGLAERWEQSPSRGRVRLRTNWSYLEGIRAEELSRCSIQAEREALRAESLNGLAWALGLMVPVSTDSIWKTILKCQHHDVYCFSAPELRDKAIGWLAEAATKAAQVSTGAAEILISHTRTDSRPGQPVVVLSSFPYMQDGLVEVSTDIPNPVVYAASGDPLPCEALIQMGQKNRLKFAVRSHGFGFSTCWIRGGGNVPVAQTVTDPVEFENPYYRAVILPDGAFSSLKILPSGVETIDAAKGTGSSLSATDSSQITFHEESVEERIDRYLADPAYRGPRLSWKAGGPANVDRSALGITLTASGQLGDHIQITRRVCCYHLLPRIDITLDFFFDQASIGTFFDDDSKLLVSWPLALDGKIHHDIPFGVIQEREDRPFFPTSWIDYSDGEHGIAFFHQGTPNHWVSGNTLFNLLAWGEETDAIHNGLGRYQWLKSFDQRLDGRHTIELAVLPHAGDWRAAGLPRAAQAYGMPPIGIVTGSHPGSLPSSLTLLQLTDPDLVATSIQAQPERLICRLYPTGDKASSPLAATRGLQTAGMRLLRGGQAAELAPYQIGELILDRNNLQEED